MKKISFNKDWICYEMGFADQAIGVTLPHDAMLMDEKSETSPAGVNTGWYLSKDYTYEKNFYVSEEYKSQKMLLEFEGVYHKATVYINGQKAGYQDYGYLNFYIDPEKYLHYGRENQIQVVVINSDQPNSRWYTGTGIYRPVWLYILPKQHIALNGIKITTLDYQKPEIQIEVAVETDELSERRPAEVLIEIMDGSSVTATYRHQILGDKAVAWNFTIEIKDGKLWSPATPNLYICKVTYGEDIRQETFGIRVITWNSKEGLLINGKREILRGACIHHDNGLLGACAYDFAEKRKIKLLQKGGYNAIRSAHNPCSKAMLRACDELGMLVMDEYVDYWYIHKTKYDYAGEVLQNYKEDMMKIVDKDYNHPSVILYSTGNEVAESAQRKGIQLCKELTRYFHELDSTRPVSCGINIFFNFLSSIGMGVYSDKKADQAVKNVKKKKAVGSEFFNTLAGFFGSNFMKFGATLYPCDLMTRDAFDNMDIAGYNYGELRYTHDLKKYPNRIVLGSETFCSDAYRFWEQAKQNPRLIGDFVWTGMDYLGEVGIGAWEYNEYAPRFDLGKGWISAGAGRIDLTGKELCEMKYTKVAFELNKIGMGIIPVKTATKKHSPSAWKMTNALESWSWSGCEGMKTKVEVYARAYSVSLFLNGTCIGKKRPSNDCRVEFPVTYENGELTAVAYDAQEKEIARTSLHTAHEKTILTLEPESMVFYSEDDLCYVRMRYTDKDGITKPLIRGDIHVEVENGKLIGIGSACPYYEKSYLENVTDTYYGEAMAILRPLEKKTMLLRAKSAYGTVEVKMEYRGGKENCE